jgi:uncharacterized protein
MLKIDLSELVRQPGRHINVDLDENPPSDEDVTYLAPARGRITITNSGDLILVRGKFTTAIELECGRCLGEVRQPIAAEIEEQFTLSEAQSTGHHDAQATIVADEENEVPEGLMDGNVMDLAVLIRQAAILNAPLSALCKESCLGMCPTCGKNRNLVGCNCEDKTRHTPLAVLKKIFEENADSRNGHAQSKSDDAKF